MPGDPPLIRIDLSSSTPAYEQIAGAIRGLLVSRILNAGDVLPPVRQLATDLAVHFNTVAQAYRILAEEGWLDVRRGRGAKVIHRAPQVPGSGTHETFSRELNHLVASALTRGLSHRHIRREVERLLKLFPAHPV